MSRSECRVTCCGWTERSSPGHIARCRHAHAAELEEVETLMVAETNALPDRVILAAAEILIDNGRWDLWQVVYIRYMAQLGSSYRLGDERQFLLRVRAEGA